MLQYLAKILVLNTILFLNTILDQQSQQSLTVDNAINIYHRFIRDGSQTPWNQLRENMRCSSAFAFNAGSVPLILWLGESGKSLVIDGIRVDLADIKSIAKNAEKDL